MATLTDDGFAQKLVAGSSLGNRIHVFPRSVATALMFDSSLLFDIARAPCWKLHSGGSRLCSGMMLLCNWRFAAARHSYFGGHGKFAQYVERVAVLGGHTQHVHRPLPMWLGIGIIPGLLLGYWLMLYLNGNWLWVLELCLGVFITIGGLSMSIRPRSWSQESQRHLRGVWERLGVS